MELATPITIYWDLPDKTADTGFLLRICADIMACRPLMLHLRAPDSEIGEGTAAVLARLKGAPIAVSLTIPLASLTGSARAILYDDCPKEIFLAIEHPEGLPFARRFAGRKLGKTGCSAADFRDIVHGDEGELAGAAGASHFLQEGGDSPAGSADAASVQSKKHLSSSTGRNNECLPGPWPLPAVWQDWISPSTTLSSGVPSIPTCRSPRGAARRPIPCLLLPPMAASIPVLPCRCGLAASAMFPYRRSWPLQGKRSCGARFCKIPPVAGSAESLRSAGGGAGGDRT